MKKETLKLLIVGLLAVFVVGYGMNAYGLLGLPGNIDLFVKDGDGNPLEGVRCSITNPPGCDSGRSSCQLFATSNSAGWCSFNGLPSGEIYSWGASCNNPSGITRQGSASIVASNTYSFTTNVYVTLPGCMGTISPVTTTTTQPNPNCGSPYTNKCYNGDVWKYDSCNNRDTRVATCGTYGCTSGNCVNAPTTTQPVNPTTTQPGVTSTTQPPSCIDVCSNTNGCFTNENDAGFRCVQGANGCRTYVEDASCSSTGATTQYVGLIAGIIALGILSYVILRRK